jgi:glutathione S-transferase
VVRRYNPLVRIPVLVLDDGSNLFESAAILDEIDRLGGTERCLTPRPVTASRCTDDRNCRDVRGEGSVVLLRRSRATRGEAAHTLDRAQRQAGPCWLRTLGRDRSQGRPRIAGTQCISQTDVTTAVAYTFASTVRPRLDLAGRFPRLSHFAKRLRAPYQRS